MFPVGPALIRPGVTADERRVEVTRGVLVKQARHPFGKTHLLPLDERGFCVVLGINGVYEINYIDIYVYVDVMSFHFPFQLAAGLGMRPRGESFHHLQFPPGRLFSLPPLIDLKSFAAQGRPAQANSAMISRRSAAYFASPPYPISP